MKPQIFALLLLFIIVSCSAPLSSSSGKAVESSGQEHPPISITSGLDRTTFDRIYEYDPVDKKYYAEGKNFRLEVTDRNELMIYGPNDLDTDVVYEDNAGRLYDNSYLIYTYKIGSTPPQVGRARGDHATQLPYVDSEMDTSQVSVPPPQPTPTIAPKPVTPASPGGAGDADAKNAMAQAAASAIGAVNKAEKHSSADTNLARNRDGTYTADGKTFRLVQSSGNPQEQRYETAHGFGQEYFVLIVTETGYAIGRYNGKNELADIKQVTTNTKTSPQPEVTPNPIIAHQFEAAVRDGTLSLTRQSAQGSALTSAEVTALERATRSEKPESVYINTKGQVSNNEEYGSQLIPLPLAQVLASQEGATVRKEGKSWSFVMPPNIQTSGFVFKNFVTEEKVITPHGGTWTETVETTRESCTSCDEKTGARTFEGKTGLSLEYEPVKVGKDPSEVKVLKSSTLEFFNSRDTIGASVITAYLDKAALTDRITKSKSLSEAEKKYKLGQIKNLPENYRAQGDIKVTTNQPGYGVGINEEGDYVELDSDGNLLDDGNHKLSKGDARARLTSGLADPDVADNALRNMADQALNRGIHGVSFSIGFARLEFGVLDVLYTLGPARSLGFLLRSYEQYNGLAKVTSLTWAPGWNREALARQFCLGAGIENCLVSATCGQIHEITADNVLAGRGPGGELVSSASLNAQRSGPINVSGLTRQQILDIMGNTTVMKGRSVDLTDPSFNPETLGNISIRLYHVEYSVTNSAEEEDLKFNVEFKRSAQIDYTPPPRKTAGSVEEVGDIQAFFSMLPTTSYGEAVFTVPWFSTSQIISKGSKAHDHKYKYSTNEYDGVCLTFDPGLPSGGANSGKLAHELCVPFREYTGGALSIEQIAPKDRTTTPRAATAPARVQPEGLGV